MISMEEFCMRQGKTQLQMLFIVLSDGEWHWTDELAEKVGPRFSVSIQTARESGHNIERVQEGRQNRYRWAH